MKIKVYDYDLKGDFGEIIINPRYIKMMQSCHNRENNKKFFWLWIEGFNGYIIDEKTYLKLSEWIK